jgi:hypothetical protein
MMSAAVALFAVLSANPASAQVDLSGTWLNSRYQDFVAAGDGPLPMELMGIPFNADGRVAALTFNPEHLEELQRQCQPYLQYYMFQDPIGARFYSTTDPTTGVVIAWHLTGTIDRMPMTIWMDGRKPPSSRALHTFSGFTTGSWRGNTLVTMTTHLKQGMLMRAGAPASDQATLQIFWTRHDNQLMITAVVRDPVYLTAPWVTSQVWQLSSGTSGYGSITGAVRCVPEETVAGLSDGYHWSTYPLGKNPNENYMMENFNIPLEAATGGAPTMYPEYRKTLAPRFTVPTQQCTQYCCGAGPPGPPSSGDNASPPAC